MLGIAAALALVVGPILLLIGFIPSIISGFMSIVTVVKTVGKAFMLLTNPIGLIVVAVIGLAYLIYRYWDEIKEFTIEVWNAIADFFVGLWESITETAIEAWNAIAEFFAELWESIVEIAVMAWEGLIEVFAALMHPFIEIFENMKDGLVAIWEGVLSFFEGIWELIKNVFLGAVLLILNLVTGNFEELKSNAIAIWNNIKDALGAIWEGIKGIVSGAVQAVWGFVTTAWDNIKLSTSTVFNAVRTIITTIWDGIKSFFTETLSNIWTTVTDKFSDIVSATSEKMGEVKDKIVEIWDGIIDFFKGIDLTQIGKDVIQGLINGIGSMASAAWDKAKEVGNGIVNGIKGVLKIGSPSKVLREVGVWTGEGLAIGLEKANSLVAKAADGLAESAIIEPQEIDMSYATPDGVRTTLSSAVRGTVDVDAREDKIVDAIDGLRRDMSNMRIELDRREMGRFINGEITQGRSDSIRGGGRRRIL